MKYKGVVPALAFFGTLFCLFTLSSISSFAATEKVLHSFSAFPHGDYPSGLVADAVGNFYGVAQGGSHNQGIVYRLVADTSEGSLRPFFTISPAA